MLKPQIIAAVLGGLLVGYSAGRLTRVGPTSVPSETEVGFDLAKALSAATAPPPQEDSDWACFEGGREPEPGCPRPLLKRMSLLPRTPSAHSGIEDGPFCGLNPKQDIYYQFDAQGQVVPSALGLPFSFATYKGRKTWGLCTCRGGSSGSTGVHIGSPSRRGISRWQKQASTGTRKTSSVCI